MTPRDVSQRLGEHLPELICRSDRVMAAVSGGADSVALLHVLAAAQRDLGFELSLCHLNHQLRGDRADADEAYVRQLSDQWSIPSHIASIDVHEDRRRHGGSLEEAARRVRYEFFESAAAHFNADKVAVGHQLDDQCETILFNMIRGASIHGLRGMPRRRQLSGQSDVELIRPLLHVAKEELVQYLQSKGITWREDHTNYQLGASRNVIRHKVLPALEHIHRGFRDHLVMLADTVAECEMLVNKQAEQIVDKANWEANVARIDLSTLQELPRIVTGEVVRRLMIAAGVSAGQIAAKHLDVAIDMIPSGRGRVSLAQGCQGWVDRGQLFVGIRTAGTDTNTDRTAAWSEPSCRFGQWQFVREIRPFDTQWFETFVKAKSQNQEAIDAGKIDGTLTIRYAQPGERFQPLGTSGAKKIGDFLTDRKVPIGARPALVVSDGCGVIWVVGQQIADRMQIEPQTKSVMLMTVTPIGENE